MTGKQEENLKRTMAQFSFDHKWIKQKFIARGAFGCVYTYFNLETKQTVAVKVETPIMKHSSNLQKEYEIYSQLSTIQTIATNRGAKLPAIHWFGQNQDRKILVMEHLGPSLYHMRKQYAFSLQTVCQIAEDLLFLLQDLHTRGFYHGDIKAGNVLMGPPGSEPVVYLVDFGCASSMGHARTIGAPWAGRRAKRRRVDLIALLEMLLVLLPYVYNTDGIERPVNREGCLRFCIVRRRGDDCRIGPDGLVLAEDDQNIAQLEECCCLFPTAFLQFGRYVLELESHHATDFEYLRSLFRSLGRYEGGLCTPDMDGHSSRGERPCEATP